MHSGRDEGRTILPELSHHMLLLALVLDLPTDHQVVDRGLVKLATVNVDPFIARHELERVRKTRVEFGHNINR